jgi:hypothetical protein
LLSRILHSLVCVGSHSNSGTVVFADHDNPEAAILQHAGEFALAVADGQGFLGIIPVE